MSKVAKFVIGGVILGALSVATFGVGTGIFGGLVTKIGAGLSIGSVAAGAIAGGLYGAGLGVANLLKPKLPSLSSEFGREIQLNGDPTAVRKVLYGEAWTAGTLRFRGGAGLDNNNFYMVIVLAGHEIDSVTAVEFEDEVLTIDGSGDVTSPAKYAGDVNVRFYLGTDDQTADATLVSEFTNWTTDHRLRGTAYAIVKLTYNQTHLNSVPRMLFRVRGRRVYDPRLDSTNGGSGSHRVDDMSTWEWSANACLCANDFLMGPQVGGRAIAGLNVPPARVSWSNLIAEANVCDEAVTLDAGGTQPRYTVNGFIDPTQSHGANIRHFEVAIAGDITFSDGRWRQFAGAFRTPTLDLEDRHFIGPLRHLVHKGESARVDMAQGVYASSDEAGEVLDYAPVRLSTAVVGQERVMPINFALVNNGPQAQRCSKILLEKEAAGKQVQCTTSLYGFRAVPGETINITHAAFGLSAQAMRVIDVQLTNVQVDDDRTGLAVDLVLEAGPSSLYTWNAEEDTIGAPPDLPQADVPVVNGSDGANSAPVIIYQRTATLTPPSLPSATTTYTFSSGNLTGLDNGWSTTLPSFTGRNRFLWASNAVASAAAATDDILSGEWAAAQRLADTPLGGRILDSSAWVVSDPIDGSVGVNGTWSRLSGTDANAEIDSDVIGPFGGSPKVYQVRGDGGNPGWFHSLHGYFEYDAELGYIFYCWIRRVNISNGIYLGYWANVGTDHVETLAGVDSSNPYFVSNVGSILTNNKWYLAVGIVHPDGYSQGDQGLAGIYDPADGSQVYNGEEYRWNGQEAAQTYFRFGFFDNAAPVIPTTDGVDFTGPLVYPMDGSEPTIESILYGGQGPAGSDGADAIGSVQLSNTYYSFGGGAGSPLFLDARAGYVFKTDGRILGIGISGTEFEFAQPAFWWSLGQQTDIGDDFEVRLESNVSGTWDSGASVGTWQALTADRTWYIEKPYTDGNGVDAVTSVFEIRSATETGDSGENRIEASATFRASAKIA